MVVVTITLVIEEAEGRVSMRSNHSESNEVEKPQPYDFASSSGEGDRGAFAEHQRRML